MRTIRIRQTFPLIGNDLLLDVQNTTTISQLQKLISQNINISVVKQKLYFSGKELTCGHTISDYKINHGDVIQLMIKKDLPETTHINSPEYYRNGKIPANSSYYKIGDSVDVVYQILGAWFEAKIIGIFVDKDYENKTEENLTFEVVMDRDEPLAPLCVKFGNIRPRARYLYSITGLEPGMIIFVNYNINKPRERGYWYDFEILKIDARKRLHGTLLMGENHEEISNCTIRFTDELMRIEKPTLLSERCESNESGPLPLRKLPLYCKKCKDVSSQDCKDCSCNVCGKKSFTDKLIICDECDFTYHLFCLDPPMEEIPAEAEWYCPDCKVDENEIVKAGENLKKDQNLEVLLEDDSTPLFGSVEGIDVGTWWNTRSQVIEDGVHSRLTSNISADSAGVYSIILETRHELQEDNGYEFYYISCKPRNGPIQFNDISRRLAINCNNIDKTSYFWKAQSRRNNKPIRVVRSWKLSNISKFAPKTGYRYDGLYRVIEYFPEIQNPEFIVWRFLLKRDDPAPAPWVIIKQVYSTKIICTEVHLQEANKRLKVEEFRFSDEICKFIDNDSVNDKLWDECKKCIPLGKQELLNKIKETFRCVCCQDVAVIPVTTSCKHNICYECLQRCFHSEIYSCPCCRMELDKKIVTQVNHNLNAALKLIFKENV